MHPQPLNEIRILSPHIQLEALPADIRLDRRCSDACQLKRGILASTGRWLTSNLFLRPIQNCEESPIRCPARLSGGLFCGNG